MQPSPFLLIIVMLVSISIVDAYAENRYNINLLKILTGYNDSDGMFNTPYGAVIDSNGRIIVTDNLNNRIQVFDSNGNFLFKFGIPGYDPGGFTHPSGVTVNSNGDIIVADLHNYRVQVFDRNGVYKFQFGKPSSYDGQFTYPISVAVDSKDRIIVTDTYMHRIQVFDSNGNFLFKFGKEGSGDGEFSFPTGVAVRDDMLVVVDTGNNRVQVFKISSTEGIELGRDEGKPSLQLLNGTVDVGQSLRAVVHSSMNTARFIWIGPDGSIVREVTKEISNGKAEDEFIPSMEGVWSVEVELSNGSNVERLNATARVIPEFPLAPPLLAGLIAMILLFTARLGRKD